MHILTSRLFSSRLIIPTLLRLLLADNNNDTDNYMLNVWESKNFQTDLINEAGKVALIQMTLMCMVWVHCWRCNRNYYIVSGLPHHYR